MTVAVLLRRAMARPGQVDDDQVLGPCERGALVAGLELARALTVEAIAIAVGPARREERVLAMALRAGCARAVRVGGEGLDELDYLGLAEVLAAAATSVDATVVVCGDRSVDERSGAIAPAVAELLGWPHLTAVTELRPHPRGLEAVHLGGGRRIAVQLPTPAVIAVLAPAVRANDAGTSAAVGAPASQAIVTADPASLGIELRRLSPRRGLVGRLRPLRGTRQATVLPGAAELVARLREQRLVAPAEPADAAPDAAPDAATPPDASQPEHAR
ncbi:MAG: hypothetical protein R3B06_29965 [Kofleriaceae bacterium]